MGSPGKFGLLGALSAAIVASVLFGSACFSVETTTTVSGGAPLVIGHLTISGAYEDSRYHAAALAAAHFNLAGGVNGRPVVIVSRNTDVDAAQGIAAVHELVDKYGAVGIVGPRTSAVSVAVVESVAPPRKLLLVSPSATSPALTEADDDDFFFRTAPSDLVQGVVLANLAKESGYDHVAVIHVNDPYGIGLAGQFEETFTGLGGVVTKISHERGKTTFKPELERVAGAGAQALVPISHRTETLIYMGESIEGGYFDEFLLVDANKAPETIEAIGWEALEGVFGTSPGAPPGWPQRRAFDVSYNDYYGFPSHSGAFLAENYDAFAVIALAAAKAGPDADSEAIRDALRSVSNPPGEIVGPGVEGITRALALIADGEDVNYEGASGAVDFDENGDVAGTIEIWKVEGGEIKSTGQFESP